MRIKLYSTIIFVLLLWCLYVVFFQNTSFGKYPSWNGKNFNKYMYRNHHVVNIALVVCGHRLQESLAMIKSVILYNYYNEESLHFWIFAEDKLKPEFDERLSEWRSLKHFDFDIKPLTFPTINQREWKTLFKPCASQRLFLPLLLPEVDSVLYVDTDVIFLSPISDIWHFFYRFNTSQFAALTAEHEDENIGWYNRFARHPYYGKTGVNSGVMLMNLTRMRINKWVSRIVPIYNEYKLRITWGDQDIINVFFYYNPDTLLLLPCQYNYRPDHCMYINLCNVTMDGIQVLHGNRGYFHSNKQPLFKAVYNAVENYKIGTNPYLDFLIPLKAALNENQVKETNCGILSKETLLIAEKIFGGYQKDT